MTQPERTTVSLVGDHPFHVGSLVTRDGLPQRWIVTYCNSQQISAVKMSDTKQHLETLKRIVNELPWAIRMLTESATPEALDRKEFARRLKGSEPALDFAIRAIHAIEERDELLATMKSVRRFVRNGIDLGYIRMPDPGVPDPAALVPDMIDRVIAKAERANV